MMEWLPIASRPDEGEFLAYDPVSGKQDVAEATWKISQGGKVRSPSCSAVQQDGEYGPDKDEFQGQRATHWMPLPQPPRP